MSNETTEQTRGRLGTRREYWQQAMESIGPPPYPLDVAADVEDCRQHIVHIDRELAALDKPAEQPVVRVVQSGDDWVWVEVDGKQEFSIPTPDPAGVAFNLNRLFARVELAGKEADDE